MQVFDSPAVDVEIFRQSYLIGREQAPLEVVARRGFEQIDVQFSLPLTGDCLLHWGLARRSGGKWTRPPKACWPEGTQSFDELAVRSPFIRESGDTGKVSFSLPLIGVWTTIEFVLFFPATNSFFKNRRYDFSFPLPMPGARQRRHVDVAQALRGWCGADDSAGKLKVYPLDSGHDLGIWLEKGEAECRVVLACNQEPPLLLHWGLAGAYDSGWFLPDAQYRPAGTVAYDERAVRTPFIRRDDLSFLELRFPAGADAPQGLQFILYQPKEDLWLKYSGNDLSVPLFTREVVVPFAAEKGQEALAELTAAIIGAEVGRRSWTLMHRFRLCEELLAGNEDNPAALRVLFVWLRFSALRQLDWQRNYNTKPRDLAGAQQSLTARLAGIWLKHPASRTWVRMILQTLGRGGEGGQGQQIRDEILNIMHRHHIKEVHGIFLEEWHQKLHNNTTPDDVVICEGYIAFLRAGGETAEFYRVLEEKGVTRERLAAFERPIVTEPEYYADKAGALLRDFENYLGILRAVHGGGGLREAFTRAAGTLEAGLRGRVAACVEGQEALAGICRVREDLRGAIEATQDIGRLLDLLYLDIALEERVRQEFESLASGGDWLPHLRPALACARLADDDAELELCWRHWQGLERANQAEGYWALEVLSCFERTGRVVQQQALELTRELQPVAAFMGEHLRCADWTVRLFAEEVVRAGAGFAVAKLLHALIPQMRTRAGLGGWQIISPARIVARVEIIDDLHTVQEKEYAEPTLLLVAEAGGDEEVPAGVAGIITRVAPDLVSHLSVRARNVGILFAACFEDDEYQRLCDLAGQRAEIASTPGGGVEFAPAGAAETAGADAQHGRRFDVSTVRVRDFSGWALAAPDFTRDLVGGKSNNLNLLRGRLPDWLHLPASLAIPFGACERTLELRDNDAVRTRLRELLPQAEREPGIYLPQMRAALVDDLTEPEGLREALLRIWQGCAGLEQEEWAFVWRAIKRVWASKWNERAFLSRRHLGLPHERLQMAVLVQQVVRADYAFVIHTVNPFTGDTNELFAEVVPGLGETLVGNYPGRALGFVCRKDDLSYRLLSLPGKSAGLYGGGVIFRSDSNGEDLEGFAGAGLYDSFLAREPQERLLDYSVEPLLRQRDFLENIIRKTTRAGIEVERICGAPQDIEGAVENGKFYIVQNRPQVGL